MRKLNLLFVAALISTASSRAMAAKSGCIAVLPLATENAAPEAKRWDKASEASFARKGCVLELDWDALRNILGEEAALAKDLRDPVIMRRVGLMVSADQIVSRFYTTGRKGAVEETMVVDVETGRVSRLKVALKPAAEQRASRDIRSGFFGSVVDADARPARSKKDTAALRAAFGISSKDSVAMRDAVASRDAVANPSCQSAQARVDGIENSVLDLKARSWALKLKDGSDSAETAVAEAGLTDQRLKEKFASRLDQWSEVKRIPPLTPSESRKLEDAENKVIDLIRRCDLPR